MALNPLAATVAPMGQGQNPMIPPNPSFNVKPYPQLGPAQGGSMAPQAQMPDETESPDKLMLVLRLAMAAGVKDPDGLGNFLKGLGFQTAARLAKPAEPRGITDNPATGPGGMPMPPGGGPPMPPAMAQGPPLGMPQVLTGPMGMQNRPGFA